MDPVSHVVLSGALVAAVDRADRSRFGRGRVPAVVLGALAPDVDCVLMPVGWDVYLRFHEIATHSLAGSVVLGGAAATLVRVFVRASSMSQLASVAILAALLHPLLDIVSGARIGLGWPFTHARTSWPLVAMGDPWLVATLTIGVGALWLGRRQLPRAARAVLIAVTVFFAIKSIVYMGVRRATEIDPAAPPGSSHVLEARWGSLTEWLLFERLPGGIHAWRVDGWSGTRSLALSWPVAPASPLTRASQALDAVRNFQRVHDLTFAVERLDDEGRRTVLWSDARYCWQAAAGQRAPDCGLWFGGTFSADGRPLMQTVHVGGWTQTRPAAP